MDKVTNLIKELNRKTRDRDIKIKLKLFLLVRSLGSVSEGCARRGFSRSFYYKWWKRFKRSKYTLEGLQEFSRKPNKNPNLINPKIELMIKDLSKVGYGSRMIKGILERRKVQVSHSTICHVLNNRRKVRKTKKDRLKAHHRRYELPIPGLRMQMDVKYVPEYVGGFRAYNYVIVDECSRWRHTKAYLEIGPKSTIDFMKDVKKYCPFPFHCIQTDNGFEFTNKYSAKAWSKKHPLDQWCEENEIEHKLIPPGEKELNGKVERSHRIDEQYFYWRAPTSHIDDFNEAQRAWMQTYNKDRPHGSLDFKTPIEKIMERIELFKQYSFIDKDYEYIKLKFLKETPISKLMVNYEKQEMRSMSFNRKLQALFKI